MFHFLIATFLISTFPNVAFSRPQYALLKARRQYYCSSCGESWMCDEDPSGCNDCGWTYDSSTEYCYKNADCMECSDRADCSEDWGGCEECNWIYNENEATGTKKYPNEVDMCVVQDETCSSCRQSWMCDMDSSGCSSCGWTYRSSVGLCFKSLHCYDCDSTASCSQDWSGCEECGWVYNEDETSGLAKDVSIEQMCYASSGGGNGMTILYVAIAIIGAVVFVGVVVFIILIRRRDMRRRAAVGGGGVVAYSSGGKYGRGRMIVGRTATALAMPQPQHLTTEPQQMVQHQQIAVPNQQMPMQKQQFAVPNQQMPMQNQQMITQQPSPYLQQVQVNPAVNPAVNPYTQQTSLPVGPPPIIPQELINMQPGHVGGGMVPVYNENVMPMSNVQGNFSAPVYQPPEF